FDPLLPLAPMCSLIHLLIGEGMVMCQARMNSPSGVHVGKVAIRLPAAMPTLLAFASAFILSSSVVHSSIASQQTGQCNPRLGDNSAIISSCSAALNSGQLKDENLRDALVVRGNALISAGNV